MEGFAIFDLDDTLVDSTVAIDRWFVELADQRGLGPDGLAFLRAEQQRPVTPEESFRAIVDRFEFPESPSDLQSLFWERLPLLVRPFDGAMAGLRALRESGWRTALLTNGLALDQRPKMPEGLHALFDVVCFADDESVRKPDPAVFHLVADRAGVDLAGGWMVGDSLEDDIAGGAAASMSTVWVSNGRSLPAGGASPDVVVATVAEVFPVLLRDASEPANTSPGAPSSSR